MDSLLLSLVGYFVICAPIALIALVLGFFMFARLSPILNTK